MKIFYAEIIRKKDKKKRKYLVNRVYVVVENIKNIKNELFKEYDKNDILSIHVDPDPVDHKIIKLPSIKRSDVEVNTLLEMRNEENENDD